VTPRGPVSSSRARPTRSGTRAQVRGDRTRAAIIAETVRCIDEEGFAAASAKHIAERAGVTWGVIQYHFGDRNGLLTAVVSDGYERFRTAIESMAVPEGPTRRRVEVVVEAAWAAFSSPESLASLEILIATRANRDGTRRTGLEVMARDMRRLGALLVGDAPGAHRRQGLVGEVLLATLRGLVLSQMVTPRPVDTSAERAVLVDLIRTFLDDPGTGSRAPRPDR
jgi:TetR/AcrR family transcriptional regulator, regulator of cefoperazone and chloramphenicol sensitivity